MAIARSTIMRDNNQRAVDIRCAEQKSLYIVKCGKAIEQLERRYSELGYKRYMDTALSTEWLERGRAITLTRLRKKAKSKQLYIEDQRKNFLLRDRAKDCVQKLYLHMNSKLIARCQSLSIVRARRELIVHKLNHTASNIHSLNIDESFKVIEALLKNKDYNEILKLFDLPSLYDLNYELFKSTSTVTLSDNLHGELMELHRKFYAKTYRTIDEMIHGSEAQQSAMDDDDDDDDNDAKDAGNASQQPPGPPTSVQASRNAAVLQRMRADAVQRKQVTLGRRVFEHGLYEHLMVFKTKF